MMTFTIEELRRLEAEAEKVSRYDPGLAGIREDHAAMFACPDGDYVRYADYLAMRNALPELLKALEGWDTEYEVVQDDMVVAGSTSLKEAMHYAALYEADGPVQIIEVLRRPLPPHGGVDVG